MHRSQRRLGSLAAAAGLTLSLAPAASAEVRDYQVRITNLTSGQPLSPPVLATHRAVGALWHPSREASTGIKEIAENGNFSPLADDLRKRRVAGRIFDYGVGFSSPMFPGPLVPTGRPGAATFPASVTMHIRADSRRAPRLSVATMLVCTNDGFTGLDGYRLPAKVGRRVTVKAPAYETQSERNTEVLADIMPPCQGLIGVRSPSGAPGTAQSNPALAESGAIIPHKGVIGGNELDPALHGWGPNPVVKFTITRVR